MCFTLMVYCIYTGRMTELLTHYSADHWQVSRPLISGEFIGSQVVIALRASGGERAVLQAFSSAREIYRTERVAIDPVDELSALFADCGITDIHSINFSSNGGPHTATPVPSMQDLDMMEGNTSRIPISAPILAESGRLQVVMDASADGSSFVCLQCGGVVSNLRRDEHLQFWCSQAS